MKKILRILRSWPFMIAVAASVVIGYASVVKRPARVLVSEFYYGWMRIEYGVKGAPELSRDWLSLNLQGYLPESGVLQTSSVPNRDFTDVKIYYGTPMEVRRVPDGIIAGRVSSQSITKPDGSHFEREFEMFFIGPDEVYEKHRNELERFRKSNGEYVIPRFEDLPKVGKNFR